MNNQQPPRRNPKNIDRYGQERQLPKMATPRQPVPSNKMNFLGLVFLFGILGGVIWLMMLVFGWGPYHTDLPKPTRTPTSIASNPEVVEPAFTITQALIPTETENPEPIQVFVPTATLEIYPFVLDGEPEPLPSVMVRPQLGCDWLVIAGQVWDLQGDPIVGLTLHLFGELGGNAIDQCVLSGAPEAIAYGESGYEFALQGLVLDSVGTLQIQLIDADGATLSLPYVLQTFNDCQKNLILVNFKQVR